MDIRVVDTSEGFISLKNDWDVLLQKKYSLFLDWQWMYSWWQSYKEYHDQAKLFILVFKEADKIVAIAPFFIEDIFFVGFKYKVLNFLASKKESLGLDIIYQDDLKDQILKSLSDFLLANKKYWDLFFVNSTFPGSFIRQMIKQSQFLFREKQGVYSDIDLRQGWDTYLNQLQPRMRTKVRKMLKVADQQDLKMFSADRSNFLDHFSSLVKLHQSRWVQSGEDGAFGGKRLYIKFFLDYLLPSFIDSGQVRIYTLLDKGKYIGHQIYFIDQNTLYLFQEGYEWNQQISDPGNVLRALLMHDLAEQKKYIYNFMSGWTFHKQSWGANVKTHYFIRFAHFNFKNIFYFFSYGMVEKLLGKIRGLQNKLSR